MQVGSRVGIRIQSDLTGTPLGGIASGTGGFHLPLQLWIKPPRVPAKNARFFSSWSTLTISVENKYPYHFCKWVRFFITPRVKVLSESTPPMLLHTEWHSGYLTLKRWYFGSKWDWVNWLGARRKAVRGESKILHSTSSTQILSPTYLAAQITSKLWRRGKSQCEKEYFYLSFIYTCIERMRYNISPCSTK